MKKTDSKSDSRYPFQSMVDFYHRHHHFFCAVFIVVAFQLTTLHFALFVETASAQSAVQTTYPLPPENVNLPGFKLSVCDGPDLSNLPTGTVVTVNGKTETVTHGHTVSGYVPCNFNGAMLQVQHAINVMIVLGVLAAIVGFCYTGFLLMTGKPADHSRAMEVLPKIFWGFIIMISAWFIVYQILSWLTGGSAFATLLGK
jgi:hypothetical protein